MSKDDMFALSLLGSIILFPYWGAILIKWTDVIIQLFNKTYDEGLGTILTLLFGTAFILPMLVWCFRKQIMFYNESKSNEF